MEHAIFLRSCEELPEGYERLYFGEEFCQELMPERKDVKRALKISSDKGLKFTLVTPYVSEVGLRKVERLLEILPEATEVVFNDFGLLWELKDLNLEPVMGRLLVKFKRDPRVPQMKLTKAATQYLHTSAVTERRFRSVLKEYGVSRIEIDNVPFQVDHGLPSNLNGSIYLPYVYLTTTRYCLTDAYASGKLRISGCEKACLNRHFTLKNKNFPNKLLQRGNAIFYENYVPQRIRGVDRLVCLQDELDPQIADRGRNDEE